MDQVREHVVGAPIILQGQGKGLFLAQAGAAHLRDGQDKRTGNDRYLKPNPFSRGAVEIVLSRMASFDF